MQKMRNVIKILILLIYCSLWNTQYCVVSSVIDEYPNYKVCFFDKFHFSGHSLNSDGYSLLKLRYGKNCTHIPGNLMIYNIHRKDDGTDPDLSFLSTIREIEGCLIIMKSSVRRIPLTNLRVIRGNKPFKPQESIIASLYMSRNFIRYDKSDEIKASLEEVDMRNLKVIEKYNVHIDSSDMPREFACKFMYSVNWTEILDGESQNATLLRKDGDPGPCPDYCSKSCPSFYGKRTCWGPEPEKCQAYSRCRQRVCSRCYIYKNQEECCDSECIGGCFGGGPKKCHACRNVQNGEACAPSCPKMRIYDPTSRHLVDNPGKKYRLSSLCMSKCPEGYLTEQDFCVKHCSLENYFSNGSNCSPCTDKQCSKSCNMKDIFVKEDNMEIDHHLTSENLPRFLNCTFYSGPILINKYSFIGKYPITNISQFNYLKSLKRILGSIYMDLSKMPSIKTLSFLENLETLNFFQFRGAASVVLTVIRSQLTHLGLRRLSRVTGNSVIFSFNPRLCFVASLNWYKLVKPISNSNITVHNLKGRTNCEETGYVCHSECEPGFGCWGLGPAYCIKCRDLRADDKCVQKCSDSPGFYHAGQITAQKKECFACHPECRRNCNGPLASNCLSGCKTAQEGNRCVSKCSRNKYLDKKGKCQSCDLNCHQRPFTLGPVCTGPLPTQGPGGCNKCIKAIVDSDNKLKRCLKKGTPCPNGMFSHIVSASTNNNDEIVRAIEDLNDYLDTCRPCDPRCSRCTAQHNRKEGCIDCRFSWFRNTCVKSCPKDDIYGVLVNNSASDFNQRICQPCHSECRGCSGPGPENCKQCLRLKVYTDSTKAKFVCQSRCPSDRSVEQQEGSTGHYACFTYAESVAGRTRQRHNYVVAGVVVGIAVIVLLCLIILVWFMRKRAESKKAKEELRVAYSNIKEPDSMNHNLFSCEPNLGRLEMINTDDLDFDERAPPLGTGAFGAVYRGHWKVPSHARLAGGGARQLEVAIKVIIDTSSTKADIDDLLEEAKIMASVSHKHCLRLIGVCLSNQRRCLVSAYVAGGSMDRYLQQHGSELTSLTLLYWPQQIANGMAYLEARGIIHRDLATRNVLVTSPELVQITDFGLAKMLEKEGEQELVVRSGRVPIRWLALETLDRGIYSHKTDVWSYGVTIWEIFTLGKRPYDNVDTSNIKDHVMKGARLRQPEMCTLDVYMVMVKCWMEDPVGRPSFLELMKIFGIFSENPGRYLFITGDRYAFRRPKSSTSSSEFEPMLSSSKRNSNSRSPSSNKGPSLPPRSSSGNSLNDWPLPRRYQESPSMRPPQPSPRSQISFDRLSGASNNTGSDESKSLIPPSPDGCTPKQTISRNSDPNRYCADPTEAAGLTSVPEDYLEPDDVDEPLPPPPPPPPARFSNNKNQKAYTPSDEFGRPRQSPSPYPPGEYLQPAASLLPKNTAV